MTDTPLTTAEFEQALRAKGAYYHINHPYHVAMYEGRATRVLQHRSDEEAHRTPAGVVHPPECRPVQMQDERAAGSERQQNESELAPYAALRRRVQVHHHAALPAYRGDETAERLSEQPGIFQQAGFGVGGDVFDRPALEEAMGAIGVDHRRDRVAPVGDRPEHQEPRKAEFGHGRTIIGRACDTGRARVLGATA